MLAMMLMKQMTVTVTRKAMIATWNVPLHMGWPASQAPSLSQSHTLRNHALMICLYTLSLCRRKNAT